MKILDFPQGSAEWALARAGRLTASRVGDVIAKIKTGEAAARRDYRTQLVAEILTGVPQEDGFVSKEMAWGTEQEPEARSAYELITGGFVEQVGFVLHPTISRSGCSPDGLVGAAGMVQFKCPKTATHLQYLMDGFAPREHLPQIDWEMACCGRAWSDFVSFDPRLPEKMRLFKVRVPRDDGRIETLEKEVLAFLSELDRMLETVKRFA